MTLQPRWLSLIGLLVLLPLAAYLLFASGGALPPLLSTVCVLLIVGSLLVMFSPGDGPSFDLAR